MQQAAGLAFHDRLYIILLDIPLNLKCQGDFQAAGRFRAILSKMRKKHGNVWKNLYRSPTMPRMAPGGGC
jgi:hypothetical protein